MGRVVGDRWRKLSRRGVAAALWENARILSFIEKNRSLAGGPAVLPWGLAAWLSASGPEDPAA
jgi:hypothetical protein